MLFSNIPFRTRRIGAGTLAAVPAAVAFALMAAFVTGPARAAEPADPPKADEKKADEKAAPEVGVPGTYGDAMRWYERAAEAGNARAQFFLGMLYEQGRRGGKPDLAAAARWFEKAAAQGHRQARLRLGLMYYTGAGVEKSPAQAAAWFERAAQARSSQAAYNLALMLMRGEGVAENPKRAAELFERAVARGIKEGALHLAALYGAEDKKTDGNGKGGAENPAGNDAENAPGENDVPQDKVKALMWHEWARQKGLAPDPAFREALAATMSADEIARAETLALERLKN